MDVRQLKQGEDYVVSYASSKYVPKKEMVGTLVTKNFGVDGWHKIRLKTDTNGRALGSYLKNKEVSIASRSILRPNGAAKAKAKPKTKRDVDVKKELEAVILMFENFGITAGLDPTGNGLVIDAEEVPRLRRVLARMFGKQLGV